MTSITEENVKPENAERYSGEIKDLLLVAQNQFFTMTQKSFVKKRISKNLIASLSWYKRTIFQLQKK